MKVKILCHSLFVRPKTTFDSYKELCTCVDKDEKLKRLMMKRNDFQSAPIARIRDLDKDRVVSVTDGLDSLKPLSSW